MLMPVWLFRQQTQCAIKEKQRCFNINSNWIHGHVLSANIRKITATNQVTLISALHHYDWMDLCAFFWCIWITSISLITETAVCYCFSKWPLSTFSDAAPLLSLWLLLLEWHHLLVFSTTHATIFKAEWGEERMKCIYCCSFVIKLLLYTH